MALLTNVPKVTLLSLEPASLVSVCCISGSSRLEPMDEIWRRSDWEIAPLASSVRPSLCRYSITVRTARLRSLEDVLTRSGVDGVDGRPEGVDGPLPTGVDGVGVLAPEDPVIEPVRCSELAWMATEARSALATWGFALSNAASLAGSLLFVAVGVSTGTSSDITAR